MNVEAFMAWLEEEIAPAATTARAYRRIAQRIARSGLGPAAWLDAELAEATASGTITQYRAAATWMWKFLADADPALAGPPPKLPRRLRALQTLRGEGVPVRHHAAFLAAVEGRPPAIRAMFHLMLATGLRVSEACDLRWDAREPYGAVEVLRIIGKGRHGRTEGGGKLRLVPLPPATSRLLDDWKIANAESARHRESPLVFPSLEGRPYSTATLQEHMRVLRKGLGPWAKDLTPHSLRHTFAERFMETHGYAGLTALQAILGHTSIDTTKVYSKDSMDHLAALMGAVQGGAP